MPTTKPISWERNSRKELLYFPRNSYNNLTLLSNDCVTEDGSKREQNVALLSKHGPFTK